MKPNMKMLPNPTLAFSCHNSLNTLPLRWVLVVDRRQPKEQKVTNKKMANNMYVCVCEKSFAYFFVVQRHYILMIHLRVVCLEVYFLPLPPPWTAHSTNVAATFGVHFALLLVLLLRLGLLLRSDSDCDCYCDCCSGTFYNPQ